jgi:23S rRNA pseudouridine2605 synthase
MTTKKNTKSAATAAKSAPKAKKPDAASRKPATKSKAIPAKTAKPAAKSTATAKKRAAESKKTPVGAKKTPAKTKSPATKSRKRATKAESETGYHAGEPLADPIGDVTSGEGKTYLGQAGLGDAKLRAEEEQADSGQAEIEAFRKETHIEASDAILEAGPGMEAAQTAMEERARHEAEEKAVAETGAEENEEAEPAAKLKRGPAKSEPARLDRLQKILSQAGVASRRSAEEMIVAGRVMVNGQVVTALGTKADAARDHIRVDGKLLHGAERHRYFMLNKPRGYVTTVSDPEGRPTVMEFFANAKERVYPVGRLDFQSEGLLLMTNDGELANLLTKAGSGVEKIYLVKVAGEPTAEELERLRGGVTIEKGEPGSGRVRTAPARIHQVRVGDNPWFEVVLIEGRNRELRKMFGAIGHFAEKIRRVGYGPLVLDLEPGKIRELDEDEVKALRLTAEGKMKPQRAKAAQMLPKKAGGAAEKRGRPPGRNFGRKFDQRPNQSFDRSPNRNSDRSFARPLARPGRDDRRPPSQGARGEKPRWKQDERGPKREWQPRSEGFRGEAKTRPEFRPAPGQARGENRFGSAPRPPFKPRSDRPQFRSAPLQECGENRFGGAQRPPFKPQGDRPQFRSAPRREGGENRFGGAPRPPFKPRGDRPQFRSGPRRDRGENSFGGAPRPPFKPTGERPQWKREDKAGPRLEIERTSGFEKNAGFGGGKSKPPFGRKPGFGSKPGGFGKFRGKDGGGAKRGFSRPGGPRGGPKRG